MKWLIVFLFCFTSFLFFMATFQRLFLSDRRLAKRMKFYLSINDKKGLDLKKFNVLVQLQMYNKAIRDQVLSKTRNDKLETKLLRAGVPLKPEEYVMFQWIITALGGGVLYLLSGNLFFLVVGAAGGYIAPKFWLRKKQRNRIVKFNEGLSDMLTTIVGSLRAGFSFAQALRTVSDEADAPIKDEVDSVLKEMQYGSSLDAALQEWKERMPSEDLDLMIQAILIQKQVGGNLATVLDSIVQTIRDRNRIQRQIRTLTAQGRLSGIVIGLLPVALGLILYLIEPNYIGSLFGHPIGLAMLAAGIVSGTIGFVLVRKITTIEV